MTDLRQYLMDRVGRVDTPCWNWRSYRNKKGYGIASHTEFKGYAHRLAYELLIGPIPEGLEIHHKCFNRACVNPDHLEPVTHSVNLEESRAASVINKKKTQCVNGHPFDDENTIWQLMKNGKKRRFCRACTTAATLVRRRAAGAIPREQYLALSGQQTHCPRGHEFTPENTYLQDGRYKTCRTCKREAQRLPGGHLDPNRVRPTNCLHGHEWTPENTYEYEKKGKTLRYCKTCARERSRLKAAKP